jgi:hypothetical protein
MWKEVTLFVGKKNYRVFGQNMEVSELIVVRVLAMETSRKR